MFKLEEIFKKKRKVALVLGGGAARGLAHIGILKVFQREKIPCDMVVGTSVGALIGAVYALGIPMEHSEQRSLKRNWRDMLNFKISKMSLSDGSRLEEIIRESTEGKGFEDLRIPLVVVTTDIDNGEEVIFTSGDLVKTIKASCSLPGIYAPVEINGRQLLDGGIKHTVPTEIACSLGATMLIASDVGFCVRNRSVTNLFQILVQAFQIKGEELSINQSNKGDVIIRPDLGDIDQLSFEQAAKAIEAGENAAEAALPELKRKLGLH